MVGCFFFQAEAGIRDLVRSRGLGDVYKSQGTVSAVARNAVATPPPPAAKAPGSGGGRPSACLLYTSDAATSDLVKISAAAV